MSWNLFGFSLLYSCSPTFIYNQTTQYSLNSPQFPHGLSPWPLRTSVCRLSSWGTPSHLPRTRTEPTSSMPLAIPLPTRDGRSSYILISFFYVLVTLQSGCLLECLSPQVIFEMCEGRHHALFISVSTAPTQGPASKRHSVNTGKNKYINAS